MPAARKHDSPASLVIDRFGGVRRLARLLDVSPSTVCRWAKPRECRGTGGLIPSREQSRILALARQEGVKLSPDDLIAA